MTWDGGALGASCVTHGPPAAARPGCLRPPPPLHSRRPQAYIAGRGSDQFKLKRLNKALQDLQNLRAPLDTAEVGNGGSCRAGCWAAGR